MLCVLSLKQQSSMSQAQLVLFERWAVSRTSLLQLAKESFCGERGLRKNALTPNQSDLVMSAYIYPISFSDLKPLDLAEVRGHSLGFLYSEVTKPSFTRAHLCSQSLRLTPLQWGHWIMTSQRVTCCFRNGKLPHYSNPSTTHTHYPPP